MLMHKVTYKNKGGSIIHVALFTDRMEAQNFKDMLDDSNECEFVSLSNWTWKTEVED